MFGEGVTIKAINHLQVSTSFGIQLEFEDGFLCVTIRSYQN